MAAIDIVHRLNPQMEFSREKLTEFLIHLRDLAAVHSAQTLASELFSSVHPEVLRLSDLKDEWAGTRWWDVGSQLRIGVEMGRLLVKVRLDGARNHYVENVNFVCPISQVYGRVVAEARMRGISVEDTQADAAAIASGSRSASPPTVRLISEGSETVVTLDNLSISDRPEPIVLPIPFAVAV